MSTRFLHFKLTVVSALLAGAFMMLQPATPSDAPIKTTLSVQEKEPLSYNRDIRPILAEHCFACHGPDSAARQADLRLDKREAAVESGAFDPDDLANSELLARIFSDDPDLLMPPAETKKPLSSEDRDKLRRWITEGAEYQPHWSFIVPQKTRLPAVQNQAWPKNEIDHHVLAQLESNGLAPASEADPRTLFRRLHLDITGLPPDPVDIESFVVDHQSSGDEALSKWIDQLMNRPTWGEHRARYWLDAARYADTHGMHFDNYREMWPYRDWVIRAFNSNQPYNQFTIEQLAGDLLPEPTENQLVATGFQRCNITTNEGGTIEEENLMLYASDRVQTLGWVWLGLTTNCCQCHDHKFDALTMKDYYSLAAFFRNTTQTGLDGNVKDGRSAVITIPSEMDRPRWDALPNEIAAAKSQIDSRRTAAQPDFEQWLASLDIESPGQDLPNDGLIVHLPLNEGAGNEAKNKLGESEIFTATGDVTWSTEGKLGPAPIVKPGSTFDLGKRGDFERDQPFSYGAWVKPSNNSAFAGIIARMDQSANFRGWDLWQNGNEYSVHIIDAWPDNAMKVSTQGSTVKPNQWQHLLATYDGSGQPAGIRIYVDGKLQQLNTDNGSIKPNASIRTTTATRIGQRSRDQVFDGGSVQDVRIYARELAADEVSKIASDGWLRTMLAIPADARSPEQKQQLYDHYLTAHDQRFVELVANVASLESELETIRQRSPITHVQKEKPDSPAMANILMRGEYDRPGDLVSAAPPAALHPFAPDAPANRLGLAQWVVDPANPLTARVTVNRFWQQVFGQGIVLTPEDFGVMGAAPSHPELLDWLAVDFVEHDWDVKRFFKQIFMSATYRQAAINSPEKLERDRNNALLSRGPRFRMDAEMVRDSALAASGLLVSKMYGPSVKPYQPDGLWDVVGLPEGDTRNYTQDHGEDLYRRSLYTFIKRMAPPPNVEVFNAPSREVCTVNRERTNTPLQALVVLNDPQFVEAARKLAETAMTSAANIETGWIQQVALAVLGRDLKQQELDLLLEDLKTFQDYYMANPDDANALIHVGESKPAEDLDAAKLAALTMVCNQIMNLDEALNK